MFNQYENIISFITFFLVAWVYFNQSGPTDSESAFRFSLAPTIFISFQFLKIYKSIKIKIKSFFWLHGLILTKVDPLNPNLLSVFLQHPQFLVIPLFLIFEDRQLACLATMAIYCRAKLVGVREILGSD